MRPPRTRGPSAVGPRAVSPGALLAARPRALLTCALLTCALLSSCSTAPPKTDAVTAVKKQAADASTVGDGYFRQGRYDLAIQFFDQALSYSTSIDDVQGIIQASNAIGNVYLATGSLDDAQRIFTQARDQARTADPKLLFLSTNNLGELLLHKGQAQQALACFEEALALPESAHTTAQSGILLHNIGTAHRNLDDAAGALGYYARSLKIALDNKLHAQAASDYYMIASVYSKRGDYEQAIKNVQLALASDKLVENSPGIAQDLLALGLIEKKRQGFQAAYQYFQRSYLVSFTLDMKPEMRKALSEMADCADALGNTTDAQSARSTLSDLGSP
jgi:tetratricopeptide (TPR) repeat protein